MDFSLVDWSALIIYMVAMIFVGIYFKTNDTMSNFAVADKKIGLSVLTATLLATAVGGGALIGSTGNSFKWGFIEIPKLIILTGINLFMGLFVAKKMRNIGGFTAPQMLGRVYGKRCQALGGLFCGIYMVGTGPAMQAIGLGTCIHLLLGINFRLAMIIGMGVILFYTYSSGMWGVVMTDYIQFIFLSLGTVLVTLFAYQAAGGWTNIVTTVPPSYLKIDTSNALRLLCATSLPVLIDGNRYARFFSAKDGNTARNATILAAFPQAMNLFLVIIVGMAAYTLLPHSTKKDMVFATLLIQYLPVGLKGICVAALMAAIMSTADSYMLTGATNFSVDIYKTYINPNADDAQMLKITKRATLITGLLGLGWALVLPDVMGVWTLSATAYVGGCLVPMLYGIFSHRKKSYTAAFIAMIGGGAFALISDVMGFKLFNLPAIVYGILISAVLMFAITPFAKDAKYVDVSQQ
jgi:SSS family solute:Na+ symporter